MLRKSKVLRFPAAIFFATILSSWNACAETLDLTCTQRDGSEPHQLKIDITVGLVLNGAGYDARRWAAHVSGDVVSWDEIFDWRISHISNHYVFDRTTGKLSGTSLGMDGGIHNILDAICQSNP